jgi:hypothetical protein
MYELSLLFFYTEHRVTFLPSRHRQSMIGYGQVLRLFSSKACGILPLPLPLDYKPLLCALRPVFHIKEGVIKKYGE